MKKLKILSLVMRIPEAEFFTKVARYLSSYDIEMEFVVGHESACNVFKKEGLEYYNIHKRLNRLKNGSCIDISLKKKVEIQSRFNIKDIRDLYLREKLQFGLSNEHQMLKKTLVYLHVMDQILTEANPNVIVQETGDFVAPNCLYHAALAANIHHIFIEPGMFPNRIVFTLNSFFADIPSEIINAPRSSEELLFAEQYIHNYRKNKLTRIPVKDEVFFKDMNFRNIISFSNLTKLSRKLFHKYIARKSEEYNAIAHHCTSHLLRVFRRKLLSRFYIVELPDRPFLYLPLHVPLDLQLTTRCRKYLDQLSLVEYISSCVPNGYMLLIKEHPASIGGYSYKKIKNILKHNTHVRLMHPSMNSYDIIERSKSVITINSKVGAEAIVQQKPVIVLGPTFYRGKGLTIDVNHLKCLPKAINRALDCVKLDFEKVKNFLTNVYNWSRQGELFDNSSQNISQFSESLMGFIKGNNIY
jgi:hypothetical protein